MSKEYKKLRGNRILLEMPRQDNSKVIVDENTKEALKKAFAEKMLKAVVYDVGDVSDIIKGDIVLVDPKALSVAPLFAVSPEQEVILISPFDVILIW